MDEARENRHSEGNRTLTLGSLFSGIGGLELGLEMTGGFRTIWQCEIDPYCREELAKHWPGLPIYGDITQVDWIAVERPDVLCGGFPCQDISLAGKGAGIAEGTRSGLWFEFRRCIGVLRPRIALIENVAALAIRGLDIVLADLAEAGYDAEWADIRASDVGAPHRRERIFIMAHARHDDPPASADGRGAGTGATPGRPVGQQAQDGDPAGRSDELANPDGRRREQRDPAERPVPVPDPGGERIFSPPCRHPFWDDCDYIRGNDGALRAVKPGIRLLDDGVPRRMARLRALGNAVVPQVAEHIGRCVIEFDNYRNEV